LFLYFNNGLSLYLNNGLFLYLNNGFLTTVYPFSLKRFNLTTEPYISLFF
jgi:hypothetical protein